MAIEQKLLIDTGATTTFINQKILHRLQHSNFTHKNPYSFVLADGIAPFQVLGTIELIIDFAGVSTSIRAHVAQSLCTNIILGMDYMNLYNLTISIKHQQISIHHKRRLLTVNFDSEYDVKRVHVISTQSIYIPPHSTRSTTVSITNFLCWFISAYGPTYISL